MNIRLDFSILANGVSQSIGSTYIGHLSPNDAAVLQSLTRGRAYPAFPISKQQEGLDIMRVAVNCTQSACRQFSDRQQTLSFLAAPYACDFVLPVNGVDGYLTQPRCDYERFVTVQLSICDITSARHIETNYEKSFEICCDCGRCHAPWEIDYYCCCRQYACVCCNKEFEAGELRKTFACGHGAHFGCAVAVGMWCPECASYTPGYYLEHSTRQDLIREYLMLAPSLEADSMSFKILQTRCNNCGADGFDFNAVFCHSCYQRDITVTNYTSIGAQIFLEALETSNEHIGLEVLQIARFCRKNPRVVEHKLELLRNLRKNPVSILSFDDTTQLIEFCSSGTHNRVQTDSQPVGATHTQKSDDKQNKTQEIQEFQELLTQVMTEVGKGCTCERRQSYSDPPDSFDIADVPESTENSESISTGADCTSLQDELLKLRNPLATQIESSSSQQQQTPILQAAKSNSKADEKLSYSYEDSSGHYQPSSLFPQLTAEDRVLLQRDLDAAQAQ